MYRHAGAGDAQFFRNFLLGDHGICLNQLQDLPFPLGHGVASFFISIYL
jgi:hypothetical protein